MSMKRQGIPNPALLRFFPSDYRLFRRTVIVTIHHLSIFIADMDQAIYLFKDILGFELLWHIPIAKGKKLSALLGIRNMAAELAYLSSRENSVAIELAQLKHPVMNSSNACFGNLGTAALSIAVQDLEILHTRLSKEGFSPITHCLDLKTPEGDNIRVFCIRMENCLTLEFIEQVHTPGSKN
ncbi:MAG: hypothetical protein GY729_18160 [Desulfobacteraceae bacterium]|nr:hypothetical protein [Desulfobacteraceae bacterium]